MTRHPRAYLIGGGIGSLAAAAFMIRDAGMPGADITILEAGPVAGGSLDGLGDAAAGYSLLGGRVLTTDNYECTWDLFRSIPSLIDPSRSVYEETLDFNRVHQSNAMARLVNKRRARVPVRSMGFSMVDRAELIKIAAADEAQMGASRITDWLSPAFFESEFWVMWATTFAFQPWHSAVEFRRHLHRFILEFPRIETLGGVKRTIYNQYDSLVLPLQRWLERQGVRIFCDCTVTALDHELVDGLLTVTRIHALERGQSDILYLRDGDLVFLQNGSITDSFSLGSMTEAPAMRNKDAGDGWALWERLAQDRPGFGRPAVFNSTPAQSGWQSFTVTLKDPAFFDAMHRFTGNEAGTGGLVTFRDSKWLISIVLAPQPYFPQQPEGVKVFWGYALSPDRVGDFVAKPMSRCNGAEILQELCGHLRFEADTVASAICIPCRMPYITSMFMPRLPGDRPQPLPEGSRNLAFVSQFVELPLDVVFTAEYSVRAAQTAVYALLKVGRNVPSVTRHDQSIQAGFEALLKAFK